MYSNIEYNLSNISDAKFFCGEIIIGIKHIYQRLLAKLAKVSWS
jgi:hypothetical protein